MDEQKKKIRGKKNQSLLINRVYKKMALPSAFLLQELLVVVNWENKKNVPIPPSLWNCAARARIPINWDTKCEINSCCPHKSRKRERKANVSMFVSLWTSEYTIIISWSGQFNPSIHSHLKLSAMPKEFIKIVILMFLCDNTYLEKRANCP